jgi:hypothetical protein
MANGNQTYQRAAKSVQDPKGNQKSPDVTPVTGDYSLTTAGQGSQIGMCQKVQFTPNLLTAAEITQLHRSMGNRAVQRMLNGESDRADGRPGRRQMKTDHSVSSTLGSGNRTGLPDQLKAGLECLSGFDMAPVRVHYNSDWPFQVGALAYTQGTDIHVAPGQEKHLPHESWHVVQQMQGRVKPTFRMNGIGVNDQPELEQEAESKSRQINEFCNMQRPLQRVTLPNPQQPLQRKVGFEFETSTILTQKYDSDGIYAPLEKGEVIKSFNNNDFEVTGDEFVDEFGKENSDLEIRIKEIDENDPAELTKLVKTTVPAVEGVIDSIAAESCHTDWQPAREIEGFEECADYLFHSKKPNNEDVIGILQMTGGIQVASLADFMSGRAQDFYKSQMKASNDKLLDHLLEDYKLKLRKFWEIAKGLIKKRLEFTNEEQLDTAASVVALLSEIPILARCYSYNKDEKDRVPYPKACPSLMARTDFSKIILLLPQEVVTALSPHLNTLVVDTVNEALKQLGVPDIANVGAEDPVLPANTFVPEVPNLTALTIGNWVGRMIPIHGSQGTDLLTKRNFPGGPQEREWILSMGGYENKLDPGDKPIFEFRNIECIQASELTKTIHILTSYMYWLGKMKENAVK